MPHKFIGLKLHHYIWWIGRTSQIEICSCIWFVCWYLPYKYFV